MQTEQIGEFERALINRYQGDFPLTDRPFRRVADALGGTETAVMSAIYALQEGGWISRFGPLYNAERLGGRLTLAAMAVPETELETTAEQVNRFREVAHNYHRDHRLNLWFVLATDSPAAMTQALRDIEAATGRPVYDFPKEREFFLGLWFELGADGERRTRPVPAPPPGPPPELDELDRRIVAATQIGLPLTREPMETVAEEVGGAPGDIARRMQAMLAGGAIRRIGLVPNHYKLGFHGNGMTVWDIPDERLESVGREVGELDFVSHCYARPRHRPLWPYNLFAMVHAHDRPAVLAQVEAMRRLIGERARTHDVLFSRAVLKKTGMRLPT